jgi:hypothetical protein
VNGWGRKAPAGLKYYLLMIAPSMEKGLQNIQLALYHSRLMPPQTDYCENGNTSIRKNPFHHQILPVTHRDATQALAQANQSLVQCFPYEKALGALAHEICRIQIIRLRFL